MNITEKYLKALAPIDDWITVSEWAVHVGIMFPALLGKAEKEAAAQANDTTGVREIAARISSAISRGAYASRIELDTSEKPRKVRFLSAEEQKAFEQEEIEEDTAPLDRQAIVKSAKEGFTPQDKYREEEFEAISKQLKRFFNLDFQIDHAQALLSKKEQGKHHPDNLQLLLKAHNASKNNTDWVRFTFEEQVDYIKSAIHLQGLIAGRMGIEIDSSVLDSLFVRLKQVY